MKINDWLDLVNNIPVFRKYLNLKMEVFIYIYKVFSFVESLFRCTNKKHNTSL